MRKFISCLGDTDYRKTHYYMQNKDKALETRFVQKAIINLMPEEEKPQKIFIATTQEAYKKNWISKNGTDGLEAELKVTFPEIESRHFMIPKGQNEDEIWELFRKVLEQLEEGDEVVADITYAFRFIPMIMITILNYAKTVKKITVKNIYYGQFDKNEEFNPILSLKLYDQLLDWTQATNTFLQYGNSRDFTTMMRRDMEKKQRESSVKEEIKDAGKIKSLSKCLDTFTDDIATCRGGISEKSDKSILKAYQSLDKVLDGVIEENNRSLEPLTPLLEIIKKKTGIFRTEQTETPYKMLDVGMAASKWCIDNNMIPMALTAMTETMITYMCIQLGCGDKADDKIFRENVGSPSITYVIDKMKETEFKFGDKLSENEKQLIQSAQDRVSKEFVRIADQIRALRNDVNHFGLSNIKNAIGSKDVIKKAGNYFKEMVCIMGYEEKLSK